MILLILFAPGLINQQLTAVRVLFYLDPDHNSHGSQEAQAGKQLADPHGPDPERICPKSFNPNPTQAIPGDIHQENLTVIFPFLGEEMQQDEAQQVPERFIEKVGCQAPKA